MRIMIGLLALCTLAAPAAAQQFPAGWQGRVDRANQNVAEVQFMTMGGGLHIVTGPHVILWHPDRTAKGAFNASATFAQAKAPERLEGFGILVGGQDLDKPTQDYLYFLARHDGSYMIRHRAGDEVHTLADWTPHAAIKKAGPTAAARNTLAIDAQANRVRFLINDDVVHTIDRVPMLQTDGIVGLRIGHHMNVQVFDFNVVAAAK